MHCFTLFYIKWKCTYNILYIAVFTIFRSQCKTIFFFFYTLENALIAFIAPFGWKKNCIQFVSWLSNQMQWLFYSFYFFCSLSFSFCTFFLFHQYVEVHFFCLQLCVYVCVCVCILTRSQFAYNFPIQNWKFKSCSLCVSLYIYLSICHVGLYSRVQQQQKKQTKKIIQIENQ